MAQGASGAARCAAEQSERCAADQRTAEQCEQCPAAVSLMFDDASTALQWYATEHARDSDGLSVRKSNIALSCVLFLVK